MGVVGYAVVLLGVAASLAIIIILLVYVGGCYAQSVIIKSLASSNVTEYLPIASEPISKRFPTDK